MLWRDLVYSMSIIVSIACVYLALSDPSEINEVMLYTACGSSFVTLGIHLYEMT